MRVDYTAIADADPGGTIPEAFSTLSAQTTTTSKGSYRVNQMQMANELGLDDASDIRSAFEIAVGIDQLPAWIITAMDRDGIDICHPAVAVKLGQMVTVSLITQTQADALIALGEVESPDWPGLRHGHIQNAREKRAEGKA